MEYRREIDGLRALAVLPVILFHAGFEAFGGGFVGVDVFFVISGYLITTILLAELEQGRFSIAGFYERRARRILPALFLVMLASLPFAWFLLLPGDLRDFSRSLVAVSLFVANILFWRESGYFDTATELKPLLHTWSLAVEEQYYALFPLFLMAAWKLGRRWILVVLGLVFVASLALAQWAVHAKPSAAFYLLPMRGWELLVGAFAAFYLSRVDRPAFGRGWSEFGSWLGLALIGWSVFAYTKSTPFPGLAALAPTIGTVLIVLFATPQTSAGRFMGNQAFVGIGLISYGAYLWHQPLFAFARVYTFNQLALWATWGLIALSFALAVLTFFYVETPFRSRKTSSRNQVVSLALLGAAFFIFAGATGYGKEGFPGGQAHLQQAMGDWQHPGNLAGTGVKDHYKHDGSKPVDVLFFGDSHAEQLAPLSTELAAAGLNAGFLTGGGCPPVPGLLDDLHGYCLDLFDRLAQVLRMEPQVRTIVVAGCFNCYFIEEAAPSPELGGMFDYYYLQDGEKLFLRRGRGQPEALASLRRFLQGLAPNYKVVFLGDNPSGENFDPWVMMAHARRGDSTFFRTRYPDFTQGRFAVAPEELALEGRLRSVTPASATYVSLLDLVCPGGVCKATDDQGSPVYKDASHMRPAFVRKVVGPPLLHHLR